MRPNSFELTTASPQVILYKEMRAFSAALPSLWRSQFAQRLCAASCTSSSAIQVPLSRHESPVHVPLLRHESHVHVPLSRH